MSLAHWIVERLFLSFDIIVHLFYIVFVLLEILHAWENAFSGTLPDKISELGNLREIDFAYNWLTGSIPQNIGQATSLGK